VLEEVCALEGTAVPAIREDGWHILIHHEWPGNVRELKSLLHRAVALNRGAAELGARTFLASAPAGSRLRSLDERAAASGLADRLVSAEREEILRALEEAGGVRRKAAEILGISYRGLGKKMARLGIESERAAGSHGAA
jgi:two-component system response regulator PilR (NtrC family)